MKAFWISLLTMGVVASGCKQEREATKQLYSGMPAVTPSEPRSAPSGAPDKTAGANLTTPSEVTWETPGAWQSVPVSNPMRKATYRIRRSPGDSDDAELAVFFFGSGQGGSIEANVERWLRQFSGIKPDGIKREERSANGLRQHIVKVERANFSAGMPGGPMQQKPDWGLLGAIVETPVGAYFFKVTGPTTTLIAAETDFYRLLDSVKTRS